MLQKRRIVERVYKHDQISHFLKQVHALQPCIQLMANESFNSRFAILPKFILGGQESVLKPLHAIGLALKILLQCPSIAVSLTDRVHGRVIYLSTLYLLSMITHL
jgi:hypothetical protein